MIIVIAAASGVILGGLFTGMFFYIRLEALKAERRAELQKSQAMLESQQNLFDEQLNSQRRIEVAEKNSLLKEIDDLKKNFETAKTDWEKNWKLKLDLLKEEFQTLSEKILKDKSEALRSTNKEQLESLLNPLKEKMTEFKAAVESSKNKGIELSSALNTQLKKMFEETSRIGDEAKNLVKALKGEQKTQGDWGEMILEDLLQRSGLRPGIHYEAQTTLRNDDGKTVKNEDNSKLRPDVIVHYPDGKEIIIDSKVSLSAYIDYMNSENETDKSAALTRHIRSIKSHIDELAKKNYSAYIKSSDREAVDFVIMFIPNEGPYQLAMISEPSLWNEAFKQKVMPVSPSNLLALLQLVHVAWTREDQNRNQQLILSTAGQMLERLYAFYEQFDAVGDALEKAIGIYGNATKRLKVGERFQSVVSSGEKLKALGVKMNKPKKLPERLVPDESSEPVLLPGEAEVDETEKN